jgi:hypothetical protein
MSTRPGAAFEDRHRDDAAKLREIAEELDGRGHKVEPLHELSEQLEILERPPGLLQRVTQKARQVASEQWQNLVGELEESREAVDLIRVSALGERELTDIEREKVREQLLDLVRLFPAGLIAALNTTLPVPGSSVFTPWLLVKLGLMPSRWREAHLLHQLRQQQESLVRHGHVRQAEQIGEILVRLEHDAEQREAIRRESRLMTHWDANHNGVWDPPEIAAYEAEVAKVRALADDHGPAKRWFFEHEGEVFGALRLTELETLERGGKDLLVCFDGQTGWVALEHVLDRDPAPST